jgi:anti-sigma factor RsiW
MSKDYQNNPINGEEHVYEQLSEYMDGLLSGSARDAVRAHLETCVDCRADYIELRATQKLMQSMPSVAAPRAFTLTPEMAGKARKRSFWESFFVRQNAPRLATGSFVAFLLLFLLIGNDLLGKASPNRPAFATHTSQSAPSTSNGGAASQPPASGAAVPEAAPTQTTAPAAAAVPQSTPAPFGPAAPAPESSPPGETGTDGLAKGAQPNTVVASGNSSPTTTTLNSSPFDESSSTHIAVAPAPAASPPDNSSVGWIVLQLGLFALALGLGAAAFIAWRRS